MLCEGQTVLWLKSCGGRMGSFQPVMANALPEGSVNLICQRDQLCSGKRREHSPVAVKRFSAAKVLYEYLPQPSRDELHPANASISKLGIQTIVSSPHIPMDKGYLAHEFKISLTKSLGKLYSSSTNSYMLCLWRSSSYDKFIPY